MRYCYKSSPLEVIFHQRRVAAELPKKSEMAGSAREEGENSVMLLLIRPLSALPPSRLDLGLDILQPPLEYILYLYVALFPSWSEALQMARNHIRCTEERVVEFTLNIVTCDHFPSLCFGRIEMTK